MVGAHLQLNAVIKIAIQRTIGAAAARTGTGYR